MDPLSPPALDAIADTLLSAFDNTGIGVTIIERHGDRYRLVYCNQRYCDITGYTREELAAKDTSELIPEEERARMLAVRQGEVLPGQLETLLLTRSGELLPVELSTSRVPRDYGADSVTFVRDIRERKWIERALRESEARFRSLAEASPDAILVVTGCRIGYANPVCVRFLGFDSQEELMAQPMADLLASRDETGRLREAMERIAAGEQLPPQEYRFRRKDGIAAIQELSITRVSFDGAPAMLSFGRDTHDRRARQTEMVRGDRVATIGMIAASVAHEINTPLTCTLIHLDRLAEIVPALVSDPQLRREVTGMLAEAREGGERVRALVRDLSSVARQDQDDGPISVEGPLDAAITLAGQALVDRARLVRRVRPVPPVATNAPRLGQAFLGLLLNAADAFDGRDDRNEVVVEVDRAGNEVLISITDNGRGIPLEDRERIFDPFATFRSSGGGSGLGLAISASIVAAAGGTIEVVSEPGRGTCMTVRLPIAEPTVAQPPAIAVAPTGTRIRVAVIDDDHMLVEAVGSLVATRHDAERFTDPRSALRELLEGPAFDHVLCDVHMPSLNGAELYVRLVHARPEYRGRFTFITGGALSGLAAELVASGEVGLLPKPFDMRGVLAAVERAAPGPAR